MIRPQLEARLERRILVNLRVDPEILRRVLPAPFEPLLIHGVGIAGICLIRLGAIRPRGMPSLLGLTCENAAHRIAVSWPTAEGRMTGVYIPRRDTSSTLAMALGGRAFPGWQNRARFRVTEAADTYQVALRSRDGSVRVRVEAHASAEIMAGSVFSDIDEASGFFRQAPRGYAATPCPGVFDGVDLAASDWNIRPLQITRVASSYFADTDRFPRGSAVLDSAFLMAQMETTWRPIAALSARECAAHAAAA